MYINTQRAHARRRDSEIRLVEFYIIADSY